MCHAAALRDARKGALLRVTAENRLRKTGPPACSGRLFQGCRGCPPVVYLLPMTATQQPARESMPSVASAHDKILIVDFGSQVTQLIARRVREEGVYSEIVPFHKAEAAFAQMKPKAVILSGGPESVHEEGSPRAPQAIFDSGVPVLGICYGPDDHGGPARRPRRRRPPPRVRPRRCRGQGRRANCSMPPGTWASGIRCG